MAQTKVKARKPANGKPAQKIAEVLTLAEAARFLRVTDAEVIRLVQAEDLPGRRVDGDWRFLRTALHDWLRTPPWKSGKEAMLAMNGAFKNDPFLEGIVREAYRNRNRAVHGEVE